MCTDFCQRQLSFISDSLYIFGKLFAQNAASELRQIVRPTSASVTSLPDNARSLVTLDGDHQRFLSHVIVTTDNTRWCTDATICNLVNNYLYR